MIFYEVNLSVDADIRDAYETWLPGHVRDVASIEGFVGGEWFRAEPLQEGGPDSNYVVRFALRDEAALQNYLDNHAAEMRKDAQTRFAGKFKAWRRVLQKA